MVSNKVFSVCSYRLNANGPISAEWESQKESNYCAAGQKILYCTLSDIECSHMFLFYRDSCVSITLDCRFQNDLDDIF